MSSSFQKSLDYILFWDMLKKYDTDHFFRQEIKERIYPVQDKNVLDSVKYAFKTKQFLEKNANAIPKEQYEKYVQKFKEYARYLLMIFGMYYGYDFVQDKGTYKFIPVDSSSSGTGSVSEPSSEDELITQSKKKIPADEIYLKKHTSHEQTPKQPKEQTPKQTQEQPKEQPKEQTPKQTQERPKERVQEQPKEQPKERAQEQPKERAQERVQEQPKEQPKERVQEQPKELVKEEKTKEQAKHQAPPQARKRVKEQIKGRTKNNSDRQPKKQSVRRSHKDQKDIVLEKSSDSKAMDEDSGSEYLSDSSEVSGSEVSGSEVSDSEVSDSEVSERGSGVSESEESETSGSETNESEASESEFSDISVISYHSSDYSSTDDDDDIQHPRSESSVSGSSKGSAKDFDTDKFEKLINMIFEDDSDTAPSSQKPKKNRARRKHRRDPRKKVRQDLEL